MPAEEKLKKDDPQIHLLAAKYCEKMKSACISPINEENAKILNSCIKFFAHFMKCLPECSNDVLNMIRYYLSNVKNKSIDVDVTTMNRIVGICTALIIRRKEENVIRNTCHVLKDALIMFTDLELKIIVMKYSKMLGYIFQKIFTVQTYYTQLQILEILIFTTKDLEQMRNDSITNNQIMKNVKDEVLKSFIHMLNKINCDDFINSSRKLLKFFNTNLYPKTCILSVQGRLAKMNSQSFKQQENMTINFNGRNLTISFFISNKLFVSKDASQSPSNSEMMFIEVESKSMAAEKKIRGTKHYIEINIEANQAYTYNNDDMSLVNLRDMKKLTLYLIDEESTLNTFMDNFYEKYRTNERMINDNASIADHMSIMTFQTSASMLNDLKYAEESKFQPNQGIKTQKVDENDMISNPTQNSYIVHERPSLVNLETFKVKKENSVPQNHNKKSIDSKSTVVNLIKARPKRESAKRASDKFSDIYDEENISDHEEIVEKTYREFRTQQKKKNSPPSKSAKKKNNEKDDESKYYLEPVEIVTRTKTTRESKTKINPKKTRKSKQHYETDEENKQQRRRQPVKTEGSNKKLTAKKIDNKQQEERKPLTNFDKIKNVSKDNADLKPKNYANESFVQKMNSLVQKRKFDDSSEAGDFSSHKLVIDEHLTQLEPIRQEVVNQTTKKHRVSSSESFCSGKSPNPEKKYAQKRVQQEKNVQEERTNKRRKLTIENVFDFESGKSLNIPQESTSKVEEWLKSTSDSFSFELTDNEPAIPPKKIIKRDVQQQHAKRNVKVVEDAENESEMSYGQFANDEHQHYSSSSQESVDFNTKRTAIAPKQIQKPVAENVLITTQNCRFEYPSLNRQASYESQDNYLSQHNSVMLDPCKAFSTRCQEVSAKLSIRKKKINDDGKKILAKHNEAIEAYQKKCLDQVRKTKAQIKYCQQIYSKYEATKTKLMDSMIEKEKLFNTLKREIRKKQEAVELYNQTKKKELANLKKEALRKNEETMHDVWREYIDNFQSCFNNSIKKAYEI